MNNPVMPKPHQILDIIRETNLEYTFRIETDMRPQHGQFFQLLPPARRRVPHLGEQFRRGVDGVHHPLGRQGDRPVVLPPAGRRAFRARPLRKGAGRPTSCAASTSSSSRRHGVSPVRSLLNKCAAEPDFVKSVDLICGYKNEDCILFRPDLRRWAEKFRAIYTLDSQVCEGWETGLVTTHISKVPFDSFGDDYAVIIVGPPVMMHFCGLECKKLMASRTKRSGSPSSAKCPAPWANAGTAASTRPMSAWKAPYSTIRSPKTCWIEEGTSG